MSEKKELVLAAFSNKPTSRVPVGFWFHYTQDEIRLAYDFPEMREQEYQRAQKFCADFQARFCEADERRLFL